MESMQAGLQMMLDRGELLKSLRAFKRGDFSVRMPLNLIGIDHWGSYYDVLVSDAESGRWLLASRSVRTDGYASGSFFRTG